ncbi:MAG: hypothetical protein R3E65_08385 [Steroidobacteraceae bacterium]
MRSTKRSSWCCRPIRPPCSPNCACSGARATCRARRGPTTSCTGSSAALARGEIGTTFFTPGTPDRIFVLGRADIDTDEFDQHVIAHEWGHYYQDNFSRDDSLAEH